MRCERAFTAICARRLRENWTRLKIFQNHAYELVIIYNPWGNTSKKSNTRVLWSVWRVWRKRNNVTRSCINNSFPNMIIHGVILKIAKAPNALKILYAVIDRQNNIFTFWKSWLWRLRPFRVMPVRDCCRQQCSPEIEFVYKNSLL